MGGSRDAQDAKGSRIVPVLVALIGAFAVLLVGYWQFGGARHSENNAILKGRIYSDSNRGVEGAALILKIGTRPPQSYQSDPDGNFIISKLPSTTGNLTIRAKGYKEQIIFVQPSSEPRLVQIHLMLDAKSSDPSGAESDLKKARDEAKRGWWYEQGQIGEVDGKPDYASAMRWYLQAIKDGDLIANWNIGRLYQFGYGVPPNKDMAMVWYKRGADQGEMHAQDAVANYDHLQPDQIN